MAFREKFHRAVEHLIALERDMDAWVNSHPYTLAKHFEPKTGEGVLTALLRDDPPLEWSLRVGECLYNFRSSLDQLAFELAECYTGSPLPGKVADSSAFPIFGRVPPSGKMEDKIGGVHPDAKTIIEGLQPHLRGNAAKLRDELWILERLCNLDKHRALHLIPLAQTGVEIVRGGPVTERFMARGPVHHGAVVYRWTGSMDVDFNVAYVVSFSQGSPAFGEAIIATINRIRWRIANEVFAPLAPFLQ
jgi:hypothetical protein